MTTPEINVTPLIDVLLVLLIIFMIITPSKPSSLKTRIPSEPKPHAHLQPHPDSLVVTLSAGQQLSLNNEKQLGTLDDPAALIERLRDVFQKRAI